MDDPRDLVRSELTAIGGRVNALRAAAGEPVFGAILSTDGAPLAKLPTAPAGTVASESVALGDTGRLLQIAAAVFNRHRPVEIYMRSDDTFGEVPDDPGDDSVNLMCAACGYWDALEEEWLRHEWPCPEINDLLNALRGVNVAEAP